MKPRAPWEPWVLLAPTFALLFVFVVAPLGVVAAESFFSWDLLTPPRFVGAANYRAIATHGLVIGIALRTLGYAAMVVTATLVLGLGLALALNRPGRIYAVARGSVFSAYVVSWVSVAMLWMALLDEDGAAGALMRGARVPVRAVLGDPRLVLPALAAIASWKLTGYAMVVFLGALQAVPPSLYEAAAIDGAGAWTRFRHVTIPALRPTLAFVATTMLVTSFQAFDIVRIMTQGGPARATELFVYAIYEQIFLNLSVGKASALTVTFFALLLVVAWAQLRVWSARGRA